MQVSLKPRSLLFVVLVSSITPAHAASPGPVTVAHPYALPTPPGARSGGVYVGDLGNGGKEADALIGVSSTAADVVQLHDMRMEGSVMRMRAVPSLAIGPGQHVAMKPGDGYHLMFIGIHKSWKVGDKIPLTLRFEKAGRVDVTVKVEDRASTSMDAMPGMRHP